MLAPNTPSTIKNGEYQIPAAGKSESTIRIGLPHMDVVLSLSAEANGRRADGFNFALPVVSDAMSADPVMQRLFDQLSLTGSGDHEYDGVYRDAIRLALVARWLKLRTCEQDRPAEALQKWRLKRAMVYIDEHLGEAISLADVAQTAGLSRMYFAARFRAATGLRPHEYILRRRIDRAKELLVRPELTLVDIALDVGFQTQAHFTTVFKRFVGTPPGRWRAANRPFEQGAPFADKPTMTVVPDLAAMKTDPASLAELGDLVAMQEAMSSPVSSSVVFDPSAANAAR